MTSLEVRAVAQEMLDALDQGLIVTPPTQRFAGIGFETAYLVAAELHRMRTARGAQSVGRKIGYTNRDMWAQYGVNRPIWNHVYAHTVKYAQDNAAGQSLATMVAPRIEPEIAFKLRESPPAACADPAVILRSVEWIARTFEIVDCHYADWKFAGPDSVIDFSHHAALLVGEPREIAHRDIPQLVDQLRDCRVSLLKFNTVAEAGLGANALGHPATALAHLVDVLAADPQAAPLDAGEIITTGTLTLAPPVTLGETWHTETVGLALPTLTVTFE